VAGVLSMLEMFYLSAYLSIIARQQLRKYIPATTNRQATFEELLDACIFVCAACSIEGNQAMASSHHHSCRLTTLLCPERRAAGWMSSVRFPTVAREFSYLHSLQESSRRPPPHNSCPVGSKGPYPGEGGEELNRPGLKDQLSPPFINSVTWVRERTIPTDRRLSEKLLPTFAKRLCHVVSVTNPYGRILWFLDLESLIFLSSSSSIVLTRLSGPHSRPTTSQKML
jgi:hypothetical protein